MDGRLSITLKGHAFLCARRAGLIKELEDGEIDNEPFERFWSDFEPHIKDRESELVDAIIQTYHLGQSGCDETGYPSENRTNKRAEYAENAVFAFLMIAVPVLTFLILNFLFMPGN